LPEKAWLPHILSALEAIGDQDVRSSDQVIGFSCSVFARLI
jgi:hypothetical protein